MTNRPAITAACSTTSLKSALARMSLPDFACRLAASIAIWCCQLFISNLASAADVDLQDLPLESRPYRVRLLLAVEVPILTNVMMQDILDDTVSAAQRCIGQMWKIHAEHIDWLQPIDSTCLSRVTASQLLEHTDGDAADLWFVACVRMGRPGFQIDVRSWQPELQLATEPTGIHVVDLRDVPVSILRLCGHSFRPTGLVEDVAGNTVRIRIQAGALAPIDETFAQVQPGSVFAPLLAYRNREMKIEKLQTIPWTYLNATQVDGSRVTCELNSGLRSAIGGKQRGRIETLAVAVRPQHAATQLELAAQTKPSLPLAAHRIELRTKSTIPKPNDEAAREEHLLRELLTDRLGRVVIPADPERPLVWMFAYSGQQLLARVPFVPGSVAVTRLEVPDDSTRLAAEADVQMLQGQLIDAVALRNTRFAQIRQSAKKNDWKDVQSQLDDLAKLPDAKSFLDQLAAIRVPAVTAAKARKDRAGEARINRLCDEMAELIRQYLNEEKVKNLRDEMAELIKSEATDSETQK